MSDEKTITVEYGALLNFVVTLLLALVAAYFKQAVNTLKSLIKANKEDADKVFAEIKHDQEEQLNRCIENHKERRRK